MEDEKMSEEKMSEEKIFITGYAKLPEGIPAEEIYKVISVELVVERSSSIILEAEATLSTSVAKNFAEELLVGQKLNQIEKVEDRFKNLYYGSTKKAILSSLRNCYKKY